MIKMEDSRKKESTIRTESSNERRNSTKTED